MTVYAVIGLGSIGKRHISNLRELYPKAVVYAVSASGRHKDLPEGADALVNLEKLIISKPAFVVIASPAPFHVSTAKKLILAEIPVLIEKPVSDSFVNSKELLGFFGSVCSVNVAVGYCLRFLPSAQLVKKVIEQNILGEVYNVKATVGQYLPDWRSDKNYKESVSAKRELGGGALLELSHELDYLLWLFGLVDVVYSYLRTTKELDLAVEEIADLVLVNEKGLHISVHLDFIQKSPQRQCEVIGEKGRLVWDLVDNSVTFFQSDKSRVLFMDPEYDKNNMYIDMLRAFESMDDQGIGELATISSSVKVLELVDKAKRINSWRESF